MPKHIFVLTGAGVSAKSGLGTFRDKRGEGIWARFEPMKLATPEAFARNPEDVLAFYDMRRRNLLNARPNAAHRALARLEAAIVILIVLELIAAIVQIALALHGR
jgi:NAD-dependent deacetylase